MYILETNGVICSVSHRQFIIYYSCLDYILFQNRESNQFSWRHINWTVLCVCVDRNCLAMLIHSCKSLIVMYVRKSAGSDSCESVHTETHLSRSSTQHCGWIYVGRGAQIERERERVMPVGMWNCVFILHVVIHRIIKYNEIRIKCQVWEE